MKGLENTGNVCFFNAALQCLVYSPFSTNRFLEPQGAGADVNARRKLASALGVAFEDLVTRYWRDGSPGDIVDSSGMYQAFVHACRGFQHDTQHDAHEAMVCMLDKLHDGMSRFKAGDRGVACVLWGVVRGVEIAPEERVVYFLGGVQRPIGTGP
jgi:ubiquitin C-terminal hydrolase